ncbi:Cell division control protein 31 [Dufourea novaeangliae]|uniref:Cell division control protein 31 n=1 Tax=Dufourea novaeangliae TaxID=178035 RepID=A0A154PPA9_DUFNO|nr:Cell division control protein 31 [Dufourea novaeangliae]
MSSIRKSVITENDKKRLKESFYLMDSNADGYLDYHETKAALRALGFTVKKSYVLAIIRMYDKHGRNKILLEKLSKRSFLDEIKIAFKLLTNNSTCDKITLEDLQIFNEKLECNLTLEEMELMIKEFDLDQDGSSKDDFSPLIKLDIIFFVF